MDELRAHAERVRAETDALIKAAVGKVAALREAVRQLHEMMAEFDSHPREVGWYLVGDRVQEVARRASPWRPEDDIDKERG